MLILKKHSLNSKKEYYAIIIQRWFRNFRNEKKKCYKYHFNKDVYKYFKSFLNKICFFVCKLKKKLFFLRLRNIAKYLYHYIRLLNSIRNSISTILSGIVVFYKCWMQRRWTIVEFWKAFWVKNANEHSIIISNMFVQFPKWFISQFNV